MSSDLEHLLQRTGRVRDLARALVRDAATADDVVQDALVAALGREGGPPREPSWLHRAVRSLAADRARGESGRRRREEAAARDERLASAAESVARVELSRDVAAAVLALEEPSRSAISLRYVDGLPPREIARRTGATVPTVKKRIERGLAQLRVTLEGRHGAGGQWAVALLPLVGRDVVSVPQSAAAAAASAPGVSAGAWLTTVALIGLALTGGSWLLSPEDRDSRAGASASAGEEIPAAGVEARQSDPALVGEAPGSGAPVVPLPTVDGAEQSLRHASAVAEGPDTDVAESNESLRVVRVDGASVAGLALAFEGGGGERTVVRTDRDGIVEIPRDRLGALVVDDPKLTLHGPIRAGEKPQRIAILLPAVELAGDCVGPGGAPVAGAQISVRGNISTIRSMPDGLLSADHVVRRETTTDQGGRFRLAGVPVDPSFALLARRDGEMVEAEFALPLKDDTSMRLALGPPREREVPMLVHGRVLDEDGTPLDGAIVALGANRCTTGGGGSFGLEVPPAHWPDGRTLVAMAEDGAFALGPVPDGEAAATDAGAGPYEIVVPDDMLTLRGVVVGPDGAPIPDLDVYMVDGTQSGNSNSQLEAGRANWYGDNHDRTDERGAFEFGRALGRPYTLCISVPSTFVAEVVRLDPRDGPHRVVFAGESAPIRGRIVDAFGDGAAGVEVSTAIRTVHFEYGDSEMTTDHRGPSVLTDANGWFEHPSVGRGATMLRIGQPSIPQGGNLATVEDPFESARFEVRVTLACEVDVLAEDPAEGARLSFRDAEGARLRVQQVYGASRTTSASAPRRPGGGFGRVFVDQTAVTAVLTVPGRDERAVEVSLVPGRPNRVGF